MRHRRCPPWKTPEIHLLVPGFSLSLLWEFLQSPFYTDTFMAQWTTLAANRLHCAGGDALVLLGAFWSVALGWGRAWMRSSRWMPYLTFLIIGIVYTACSEYINVHVVQRWAYSLWMPTVAGIGLVPLLQWVAVPGIGLVPLLQWVAAPTGSLWLANRYWRGYIWPVNQNRVPQMKGG